MTERVPSGRRCNVPKTCPGTALVNAPLEPMAIEHSYWHMPWIHLNLIDQAQVWRPWRHQVIVCPGAACIDHAALPLTTIDPFRLRLRSLQTHRAHCLLGTIFVSCPLHSQSSSCPLPDGHHICFLPSTQSVVSQSCQFSFRDDD